MRAAFGLGLVLLLVVIQQCNLDDEDVEREVAARCPGCEVRDWNVGEGDGEHAEVYLDLVCDEGRGTRRPVWVFQLREEGWGVLRGERCDL